QKAGCQVTALGRRLVAFVRGVVGLAAAVAAFGIAALSLLQGVVWMKTGQWSPLPFSQILDLVGLDVPRRYFPAGIDAHAERRLDSDRVVAWWLDAPAIIPLLVAVAVLVLLYIGLKTLQESPR